MKLSEAILLGRVTIPQMRAMALSSCALGMAANAVGCEHQYSSIEAQWPWLKKRVDAPCKHAVIIPKATLLIAHLFDTHVMDDCDMTFEQLVDYVRLIEPAEEIDPELAEQYRAEEEAAAEEGAEIEASGYRDPASDRSLA